MLVFSGDLCQFFTPEPMCQLLAQMNTEFDMRGKRILDPACGSGRTLLAVADIAPNNEFYGQDVDLRCVRMTVINLALRNRYGYVIWGDSLKGEQRLTYRTGFNGRGFIAKVEPKSLPEIPIAVLVEVTIPADEDARSQLSLFQF